MPTPRQFTMELEGHAVIVTRRRRSGVVTRAYPDGRITLSVPTWFTKAQATDFIETHREKILAQAVAAAPSGREKAYREALGRLAEGDVIPVWGRDVTIRWSPATSDATTRLDGSTLTLSLPPEARGNDPDAVAIRRRALEELLRREMRERLVPLIPRCERAVGTRTNRWTVRPMTSRWGSCRWETGNITINLDLATHDPAFLENVALHETCHMLAHDHGPGFKALMDRVSPDWRRLDRALHAEGVRII